MKKDMDNKHVMIWYAPAHVTCVDGTCVDGTKRVVWKIWYGLAKFWKLIDHPKFCIPKICTEYEKY
jgi:hypothetical protein